MTIGIWKRTAADPTRYFSAEEVAKGKAYQRPKQHAKLVSSTAGAILLVVLVWLGFGTDLLDAWDPGGWVLELLFVSAVTIFVLGLPGIPADVWTEFVHERKWGFSTQTGKDYVLEEIKEFLIFGVVILNLILIPVFALIRWTDLWWLWGAIAVTAVGLFISFIYPIAIMPLSNKFTPLEDEELKARLHEIARKAGVTISDFLVMDASKRTRKDNAFFTGIGATKRVVIYDNMLEMPHDCIAVVVGHELGHWRRKHTFFGVLLSLLELPLVLGLTALITNQTAVLEWAGVQRLGDADSVPLFLLVMGTLQQLLSRAGAAASRAFERAADLDALELTEAPDAFADTWRRMVDRNLPDVDPSWWARTKMSHPPVAERMAFGEAWAAANAS